MTPISDILFPAQVNLALNSKDQDAGVREVLSKLNGDPRVRNWEELSQAVITRNVPALTANGCGICIAHGRTQAVGSLVMAAGISPAGLVSPDIPDRVRLVFVAGIPLAFDSEYLRIVGAIVRLCSDEKNLEELLRVSDPARFIELLAGKEGEL